MAQRSVFRPANSVAHSTAYLQLRRARGHKKTPGQGHILTMDIQLEKLTISHFKGIKSLEVIFGHLTNICGDNATGKSTIMDAFLWLLFGKDSSDRKEFEIKHIGSNGNGYMHDVEVQGQLLVDGHSILLKRILREKWIKKRGSPLAEFNGHETILFFNEVPVSLRQYQDKIADICGEDVFKMITNPYYFPSLNWKIQRDILFDIAGGQISDRLLSEGNKDFEALLDELSGKTLEEYKKQIANNKKRIKDELELIPARIDEVSRNIPKEEDWDAIIQELDQTGVELQSTEEAILNQSKAYEKAYEQKQDMQKKLFKAKSQLSYLVASFEAKTKNTVLEKQAIQQNLDRSIKGFQWQISDHENQQRLFEDKLSGLCDQMKALRESYYQVNDQRFELAPENTICPSCQRPMENDLEQLQRVQKDFNLQKAQKLKDIQEQGQALKQEKQDVEQKISLLQNDIKQAKSKLQQSLLELSELKDSPNEVLKKEDIPGYKEAKALTDDLQHEYDRPIATPGLDELKKQKDLLKSSMDELSGILSLRDQIERAKRRIKELEHQQQLLAQEIARIEKIEFTIQGFEKAKVMAIEQKVNAMFQITRWRLFETQVNKQEVPTCKATYKKVPYEDLNSAAKANVGLDIINALTRHYKVCAPIFFDNREGVNHLIDTPCQLINLIVSKDPELVIQNP